LQLLIDQRVQRMSFTLWCLGWLVIAIESLRPIQAIPFGMSDKVIHFLGYAVMSAAVASFCYEPRRLIGWSGFTILIGGLFEFGQYFVPNRNADLLDFVANTSGAILGATIALGWLLIVVRPLRRALTSA
jgi:VanZ family protein